MPDFAYIARDMTGQKVTGSIQAGSEREVIGILSGRSLFPVQVVADKAQSAPGANLRVRGTVMATTYSQLGALLKSGVPLLKAIAVLRDQTSNKKLKSILEEVYRRVEDGTPLADAMARFPKAFSEMAINMVRAGGEGGFLEDALERVASFTEQQEDLKSRTISAMIYPILLLTAGTVVVAGLLVFIVPKFGVMFDRLRKAGELPWATDLLLWISETVRSYGWLILLVSVAVGLWLHFKLKTEEGRRMSDLAKIKFPIFGKVFLSFAVARFCRVLGTLLTNGVPILKALEISRDASGNRIVSEAIARASENISSGQTLASPLASSGHFPKMVVEMIAVAEESNTLDKVLVNLADDLERRTSRQLDLMVRLLEPMMLILMALVVLLVVVALLVPVMKMSQTLG